MNGLPLRTVEISKEHIITYKLINLLLLNVESIGLIGSLSSLLSIVYFLIFTDRYSIIR